MSVPSEADIAYMMAHLDDDRRPNYIAANAICIGFAILAVTLRFVSRLMAGVRLGWDDYTIVASLIFTIVYTAALFVTVNYGMGRHVVPYLTDVKLFAQVCSRVRGGVIGANNGIVGTGRGDILQCVHHDDQDLDPLLVQPNLPIPLVSQFDHRARSFYRCLLGPSDVWYHLPMRTGQPFLDSWSCSKMHQLRRHDHCLWCH